MFTTFTGKAICTYEIVVVSVLDRGKHLYHDIIFVIHQIAIYCNSSDSRERTLFLTPKKTVDL